MPVTMPAPQLACESTRYSPSLVCSDQPPRHEVAYHSTITGRVTERHPTCFMHGLAEVERHHASGGMATAELRDLQWPITTAQGVTLWACCVSASRSAGDPCGHRAVPADAAS